MSRRSAAYLAVVVVALLVTIQRPVYAGGIGDCGSECPPFIHICKGGPHGGLQCTNASECPKSECIESTLTAQPPWLRKCKRGEKKGQECSSTSECGAGVCVLTFVQTTPSALDGILTIIMDDDETVPEGDTPCGAAAMILEIQQSGKPRFFSQIYHCVPSQIETDADFLRVEEDLNQSSDAVDDPVLSNTVSILNRLLFRPAFNDFSDAGPDSTKELTAAVLSLVTVEGDSARVIPIVVNATKIANELEHDAHGADGLASVVRFEVRIRFVTLPPS